MDKFNRRPKQAERRRRMVIAIAAFFIPASAFALLFIFGPGLDVIAGLKGLGMLYVAAVLISVFLGILKGFQLYQQWVDKLGVQPIQGPGFTPLELAALGELAKSLSEAVPTFPIFLSKAQVISRFNNGAGCVTQIHADASIPLHRASQTVFYFWLGELEGPAGCQFWIDEGDGIAVLEFFTGEIDTRRFDWATADFEVIPPPQTLRPPLSAPISTVPLPGYRKLVGVGAPD